MTVVLDEGALIALERRDTRVLALLDELLRRREQTFVPAGVVSQVWRGSPRQHPIAKLLGGNTVRVDPLSGELAYRLGELLARTGTSDPIDAHVAWLATRVSGTVLTSDPDDIRAVAPGVRVVTV